MKNFITAFPGWIKAYAWKFSFWGGGAWIVLWSSIGVFNWKQIVPSMEDPIVVWKDRVCKIVGASSRDRDVYVNCDGFDHRIVVDTSHDGTEAFIVPGKAPPKAVCTMWTTVQTRRQYVKCTLE